MTRVTDVVTREGERLTAGSNRPFRLDGATVTLVVSGQVDIFAMETAAGEPVGPRRYVLTVPAGQVLFGVTPDPSSTIALLAVGGPDTSLYRVPQSVLQRDAVDPDVRCEIAHLMESWIEGLSATLPTDAAPKKYRLRRSFSNPRAVRN